MRYLLFTLSVFSFSVLAHAAFLDQDQIPDWASGAVDFLVDSRVISGNDDGTFAPQRPMNRAEFCKLVVNATGVTKYLPLQSHFPDIERGDWFFDFIETAQEYGWVSGYPDGYFRPAGTINRAEVAKILSIAFGLDIPPLTDGEIWSDPYFNALDMAQLLPHNTTRDDLNPAHTPSRAEIVEQVYRFMKYTGKISPYDVSMDSSVDDLGSSSDTTSSTSDQAVPVQENTSPETSSEDTSPPETSFDNPVYEYDKAIKSSFAYADDAGDLYIEKAVDLPKKRTVNRAAKGVLAHDFVIHAQDGSVQVGGFSFRRMGTGNAAHFHHAWLEMNGRPISDKVDVLTDFFFIPLRDDITITTTKRHIQLRVDMGYLSSGEKSSRFVLYRPDWIDADTPVKIGFFPLGGSDIFME